jgi:hypothetical protein
MGTFKHLQQELKNKERLVSDLIRFVKTRADQNPNYSLLLGAGCSITSDINSANELINKWRREIFIQENDVSEGDVFIILVRFVFDNFIVILQFDNYNTFFLFCQSLM